MERDQGKNEEQDEEVNRPIFEPAAGINLGASEQPVGKEIERDGDDGEKKDFHDTRSAPPIGGDRDYRTGRRWGGLTKINVGQGTAT